MAYGEWAPYVPVAARRANAAKEMKLLRKKGMKIEPVAVQGRKIARSFWGEAWCGHLEKFSDYSNRLPRGRTYVRNGSVCHLAMSKGKVEAIVSGSELYKVNIAITPLSKEKWDKVRRLCAGQIGTMIELLQGRFSDQVMAVVTDRNQGLFPEPHEIKLACDCPDWAGMCKHIAAVLYGIGARLDHRPELLFLLRGVDHEDLIATELDLPSAESAKGKRRRLSGADLSDVFGVEMEEPVKTTRHKRAPREIMTAKKSKAFTPSATAVTRLRKRFRMNTSQFARLVGVSPVTVSKWENSGGKLNLQLRTREALTRVAELSPDQAIGELERSR